MDNTMKNNVEDVRNMEGGKADIKEQTITKTEVKSMGFTDKLIEMLLPEPKLRPNPYYRSAACMQLWKRSDVEKAMKNPVFQERIKKREKRQAAAEKAVETKRAKLMAETEKFIESIKIEKVDLDVLRTAAIEAQQDWYYEQYYYRDKGYVKDAYGADEDTVKRWMVNFVRHEMTTYDEQLYYMKGKVGVHDMYEDIRNFILGKIAVIYPELAQECEKQKNRAIFKDLKRQMRIF